MKKHILLPLLIILITACNFVDPQPTQASDLAPQSDTITIASWNIQVFGKTKAAKPEIMTVIAQTIAQYDIVAVQEIRDESGTAIQSLESAVDSLGTDYSYIIGPRLGRTSSKEQYAVMYRTNTVLPTASTTYPDAQDIFHREPFIAEFKTKSGNFTFTLITIHTDPDDATTEINSLPYVVNFAQQQLGDGEQDYIILGDYNSDCNYFNEFAPSPLKTENYTWIITDDMDTTVAKTACTYDRIVISTGALEDFTGHKDVDRFDLRFKLNQNQTKKISDHYPVWATFSINSDTDHAATYNTAR